MDLWKQLLKTACLSLIVVGLAAPSADARVRKGDVDKNDNTKKDTRPRNPDPPKKSSKKADPNRIGADFSLNIPTGDWSDVSGLGIGGLLRYERVVSPNIAATFRAGYIAGLSKEVDTGFGTADLSVSLIPILAGVKWQPQGYTSHKREGLYVGAELGMINFIASAGDISSDEWEFGFDIGAGYEIAKFDIRAQALFIMAEDTQIGVLINVGYTFAEF